MAMDNQTREIRQILLGRTVWTQDGCLEALQKGQRMRFQGMGNGWGALHFLGIASRERSYQLPANAPGKLSEELLYRMGRPVRLMEQPKVSACLCRHLMSAPVLLTGEQKGSILRVSVLTAKGVLSALTCLRTLNTFEKGLPETVKPVEQKEVNAGKRGLGVMRQRKEKSTSNAAAKAPKRENKGGKRLKK